MRLYLPHGLLKRHGDVDLSDLTDSVHGGPCGWDADELDVLVCPMDPEPTLSEVEAIRRRYVTTDADDERRLRALLEARSATASPFERLWLDDQLASYGETHTEGA